MWKIRVAQWKFRWFSPHSDPATQSLINVNGVELIYHIVSNEMEKMGKKLEIQQFIVVAQADTEHHHLLNR